MQRKLKLYGLVLLVGLLMVLSSLGAATQAANAAGAKYVVLAWNDLGMHCYNNDFRDMAVLPPYNTLWVQVVRMGNPPKIVTSGITVSYSYPNNTYSVGKTNFWTYDKALFGVNLPPNVGLKGKGLSGLMDLKGDHFVAEGIPVTEFSDSAPKVANPYQLATVIVKNKATGVELTRTRVVTPVSSEMRCDNCHKNNGSANPQIATGRVATNILTLHDQKVGTQLMSQRPVLCANCHGSNALGAPGKPGVKNLSNAMHNKHSTAVPNTLNGCYNCHPGPKTKCLRDVMSTEEGMTCISCHGNMKKVAQNTNPWLNEPRCDSCHDNVTQNNALYRFSTGHGGLYCEACHDSTHAIAPSSRPQDGIKFQMLQGSNGPLEKCTVCHLTEPSSSGPHGNN
jgi:hypothetical protein